MPDLPTDSRVKITIASSLADWFKEGPTRAATLRTYPADVTPKLTDLKQPVRLWVDGQPRLMVMNADDPRNSDGYLSLPVALLYSLLVTHGQLRDTVPGCEGRTFWVAPDGATPESVLALVNTAAWAWAVKEAAKQATPPPAPPRVEHTATMEYWLANGPMIVQTAADALTIRDKSPMKSGNRPGEWYWRRDDGRCGPHGSEDLTPEIYDRLPADARTVVSQDAGPDRERSYYATPADATRALRAAALAWALAEKEKKAAAATPLPPTLAPEPPQEYNTEEWLRIGPEQVAKGFVERNRFRLVGKRPAKVYKEERYYFQGTGDHNYGTGCDFFLPNEFFTRLTAGQTAGTVCYFLDQTDGRNAVTEAAWKWAAEQAAALTAVAPPAPPQPPRTVETTLDDWLKRGPDLVGEDPDLVLVITDKKARVSNLRGGVYWAIASSYGSDHVIRGVINDLLTGTTYPGATGCVYYDTPEVAQADLVAAALKWARAERAKRQAEQPATPTERPSCAGESSGATAVGVPAPRRHECTLPQWLKDGPTAVGDETDVLTLTDRVPEDSSDYPGEVYWVRHAVSYAVHAVSSAVFDLIAGPEITRVVRKGDIAHVGVTVVDSDVYRVYFKTAADAKAVLSRAALKWALAQKAAAATPTPCAGGSPGTTAADLTVPAAPPPRTKTCTVAEWLEHGPKWVADLDAVTLTDRTPTLWDDHNNYGWRDTYENGAVAARDVPKPIVALLEAPKVEKIEFRYGGSVWIYPSKEGAHAALSRAAMAWARAEAQKPTPLPSVSVPATMDDFYPAPTQPVSLPPASADPHWLVSKEIGDRVWAVARNAATGQVYLAGGCWQIASQTYPGRGPVLLMGDYLFADRPIRPSVSLNQASWMYCPREDLFPTREAAEAFVAQSNAAARAAKK